MRRSIGIRVECTHDCIVRADIETFRKAGAQVGLIRKQVSALGEAVDGWHLPIANRGHPPFPQAEKSGTDPVFPHWGVCPRFSGEVPIVDPCERAHTMWTHPFP